MAKTGKADTAGNFKFDRQEQAEMIDALLAELSPDILFTYANALEAEGQLVVILNLRQCHKCGELNLPENVVDGKCKKCQ